MNGSIRKAGGIKCLIDLLKQSHTEVKRNSAIALWNLSAKDENLTEIEKYGGVEEMVKSLKQYDINLISNH